MYSDNKAKRNDLPSYHRKEFGIFMSQSYIQMSLNPGDNVNN